MSETGYGPPALPPFVRHDLRRLGWSEAVRMTSAAQALLAWPLLKLGLVPPDGTLTRVPQRLRDQAVDESSLDPRLRGPLAEQAAPLLAQGWAVAAYVHDADSRGAHLQGNAGAYLLHRERRALAFLSVFRCPPQAPRPLREGAGVVAWDAAGRYHGVTNTPYLDGPRGSVRRLHRDAGPLELAARLDALLPLARRTAVDEEGFWELLDRHQREQTAWRLRTRRDRPVGWEEAAAWPSG